MPIKKEQTLSPPAGDAGVENTAETQMVNPFDGSDDIMVFMRGSGDLAEFKLKMPSGSVYKAQPGASLDTTKLKWKKVIFSDGKKAKVVSGVFETHVKDDGTCTFWVQSRKKFQQNRAK